VSLPNGVSFRPTASAGCINVTDRRTDHTRIADTSVAIGAIADAVPPNKYSDGSIDVTMGCSTTHFPSPVGRQTHFGRTLS